MNNRSRPRQPRWQAALVGVTIVAAAASAFASLRGAAMIAEAERQSATSARAGDSAFYADLTAPTPPRRVAATKSPDGAGTHGSDEPPPGVDTRRRPGLDELRERRLLGRAPKDRATPDGPTVAEPPTAAGYTVDCIGDGVSGKRVVAVYARAVDVVDRSATVVPLIRQYATDVDYRINRSAGQSGEGRRVRYLTKPTAAGCEVDVRVVTLPATGDDTFDATRAELDRQGLNLPDRKYLVWVDAAVGICGLGQLYRDTTEGATNRNNSGPMYARVDAPCWGYAETHELLHTLGAVQGSAQNSTASGHCTDENDVMCYEDAEGVTLRSVCPDAPEQQVDCRLDDYFNADPPEASYLAANWNVADSGFLDGAPPPPPAPKVTVTAPATLLAGQGVTVSAGVSVPAGRTFSLAWTSTRPDCRFAEPASLKTTFTCPATLAGEGEVTATVTDSLGLASAHSQAFRFTVPSSPRATGLTATPSVSRLTYGGQVRLTGALTDTATGRGVMGMPVAVYGLVGGATTWRQVASVTSGVTGGVSVTLRPATTMTYQLVSASTSTWRTARSANRVVAVAPKATAKLAATSVRRGTEARVSVTLSPAHAGQRVYLDRLVAGTYRSVASAVLSSTGKATIRYRPAAAGSYTLRVRKPADADHATAYTPRLSLRVT